MSEDAIQFGRTLRVLRTTAGLSMRKVAQEVGMTAGNLGMIERGLAPPPSESRIEDIARVIGVPAALLMSLSHQARASALEVLQEMAEASEFLQSGQRAGLAANDYAALTMLLKREGATGFRRRFRSEGPADAVSGTGEIRLGARLDPALIHARLPAKTAEEMFETLAGRVAKKVPGLTAEKIVEVLTKRESQGSTGLGDSVAVPHGVFDDLSETALAVCTIPGGIGFEAPDGLPVRILFVLLGAAEEQADHLELLARIARICSVPGAIKKLVRAKTSAELFKRLRKLDQSVS